MGHDCLEHEQRRASVMTVFTNLRQKNTSSNPKEVKKTMSRFLKASNFQGGPSSQMLKISKGDRINIKTSG